MAKINLLIVKENIEDIFFKVSYDKEGFLVGVYEAGRWDKFLNLLYQENMKLKNPGRKIKMPGWISDAIAKGKAVAINEVIKEPGKAYLKLIGKVMERPKEKVVKEKFNTERKFNVEDDYFQHLICWEIGTSLEWEGFKVPLKKEYEWEIDSKISQEEYELFKSKHPLEREEHVEIVELNPQVLYYSGKYFSGSESVEKEVTPQHKEIHTGWYQEYKVSFSGELYVETIRNNFENKKTDTSIIESVRVISDKVVGIETETYSWKEESNDGMRMCTVSEDSRYEVHELTLEDGAVITARKKI